MGKNLSHKSFLFQGPMHDLGSRIALSFHPSWLQTQGSHNSFLYSTVLLKWSIDLRKVLCLLYPFVIKDTTGAADERHTQQCSGTEAKTVYLYKTCHSPSVQSKSSRFLLFGECLMAPLHRHDWLNHCSLVIN